MQVKKMSEKVTNIHEKNTPVEIRMPGLSRKK